jgi:hypothetical protein
VACTEKKTKFVDGKEIYGKFIEISPVLPDSVFQKPPNPFGNGQIDRVFGLLLEISPPPPTCQCAAPRPTWSGPTQLPPASLSPQKTSKHEKCIILQNRKKSLLLLTTIFSLISTSSNDYSCYIIFPLDSIK